MKKTPVNFDELFELKTFKWFQIEVYATTTKDIDMIFDGGDQPEKYICPAGTQVRVWMVSRFGDAGITDNLINPYGYRRRGILEEDLREIYYQDRLRRPPE